VSNLIEALYPLPDYRRTPVTLVRWWESRRFLFNRVVGATGLVTLSGMFVLFALPPYPQVMPIEILLLGPVLYGVMANVCYSFGWCVELAARMVWGREAPDMGPVLFRQGVIFSVGVTLLPLLLAGFGWVARILAFMLG
jgi:hypothetical protein